MNTAAHVRNSIGILPPEGVVALLQQIMRSFTYQSCSWWLITRFLSFISYI